MAHTESKQVADSLRESAQTYEQRNKVYGDSYKGFGAVMKALFPSGISTPYGLDMTSDDWSRLGVLVQMVGKMHRYCANFSRGGHDDSLLDLITYTAMLRELDSEKNK